MLKNQSKLRYNFHISDDELAKIKCFLQGAVYSWVKNRKGETFAARDLVGGDNYDWHGTPLIVLYYKHINAGKNDHAAIDEAAKDIGWILKMVIHEDKRTFEDSDVGMAKGYRWIEE